VSPRDILCAYKLIQAGESDESYGLDSDHLRNACDEFGVRVVVMLLSALLVHGFALQGKNVNVSDSSNYTGIH